MQETEAPNFIKKCTLPLTGVRVVDMIISDVGVFLINDDRRSSD